MHVSISDRLGGGRHLQDNNLSTRSLLEKWTSLVYAGDDREFQVFVVVVYWDYDMK